MRRIALLAAPLVALPAIGGCEAIVGIHDKSLGDDPSVACAKQPYSDILLCDDFDSEPEAGTNWEWDTPQADTSIELDSLDFRTAPRSVQVKASVDSQAPQQAQLGAHLETKLATGFRLAFDLRVDETDLAALPQVGVAQVLTDNLQIDYLLGAGDTCALQVYDGSGASLLAQPLPCPKLQTWTRIVIAYDATAGLSFIEDGTAVPLSTALAQGAPGDTTLIVGAVYVNPPGSTEVQLELDDVVMRGE